MIGQNKSIGAGALEGAMSRSAQLRNQLSSQWHDSIEREKDRKFREEQRKKQESAAKKAFWTGKAVDLGTGIAGGALIGGLAAGAGEAGGALAGETATIGADVAGTAATGLEPVLGSGASAVGTIGEGIASPVSSIASRVPAFSSAIAPTFKPFAGGSVGSGALLGGALGGIGGLGGQNYLGTALAMPGQNYAREMAGYNTINDNAMGWTNLGLNQARLASNDSWQQKRYDEQREHNAAMEDVAWDRADTSAYRAWMDSAKPTTTTPKSTLKMNVGPDGRTLSGHPDELTEWMGRNPDAIGTTPSAAAPASQKSARFHDTVKRFQDMASRNAGDDEYWNLLNFQKKNGMTDDEYEELMRYLGQ